MKVYGVVEVDSDREVLSKLEDGMAGFEQPHSKNYEVAAVHTRCLSILL